jgi:tyrosyl-tRNA synthetase
MGVRRLSLQDALVSAGLVTSKSEARRQIEQGGVKVNDVLATDEKMLVEIVPEGVIIQKGKRHFAKLVP